MAVPSAAQRHQISCSRGNFCAASERSKILALLLWTLPTHSPRWSRAAGSGNSAVRCSARELARRGRKQAFDDHVPLTTPVLQTTAEREEPGTLAKFQLCSYRKLSDSVIAIVQQTHFPGINLDGIDTVIPGERIVAVATRDSFEKEPSVAEHVGCQRRSVFVAVVE